MTKEKLIATTGRILLAIAVSQMMPSYAAGQHPKDLAEASLEELMNIEVYSASKHLQKAVEAPSSITVITSDDIRTYGYRTLADILRSVRSFYLSYDRNYSYIGVRGLDRPGDYNGRILLLMDGHRINDNIYDQAPIGTEFPLDVDLIERVEIIRGPVSSLYGANAFFGVINVITRKVSELDGLELSSQAASFGTYQGRISYGAKVKDLEFLTSGSFMGSRGHSRLFYKEFNAPETNYGYALHSDDDQSGSALLTMRFRDFTFQTVYSNRDKAIPTASYGTMFNTPGTRTTDTHGYVDLAYEHTFARRWTVLARVFADRYTYTGFYNYAGESGGVTRNRDSADGEWWGSELQISRPLPGRNQITAGGEYRNNFRQNQSDYDIRPLYLYLDDRRHSYTGAVFLQDEWSIARTLTLSAGVRYDYYNRIDSSTNPRVALIYRPWDRTALKAVYGTAFNAPNMYVLYYGAPGVTPALHLLPERIRTVEFVWEQGIGSRFGLSTSVYHNRVHDLISQQLLPDGSFTFGNLNQAHSTGLEIELNGKLVSGVQGKLSYGAQKTVDPATAQQLSNSPNHLLKLNLAAPLFTPRLLAGVDAQYMSSRLTLSGARVPGFPLFNLTLLGRNLGKHAEFSASAYNLLDKKYSDPGSADLLQTVIQQDGRSFRVKLTLSWGAKQ